MRFLERHQQLFAIARFGFRALQRATIGLRRGYYLHGRGRRWIERLPGALSRVVGLDDPSAVGSRRLEIGGGPHAQRGYVHVDVDPGAHHLEWVAPAWRLPLPDGWAAEVVAVHSLEHVEPQRLVATLAEWRRVLRRGGRVQVHVPNGPALMRAYLSASVEEKWPIMGSLLGQYCGHEARSPEEMHSRSTHQTILDPDVLEWAFSSAGFERMRDLTHEVSDRHSEVWDDFIPGYSLVYEAFSPS